MHEYLGCFYIVYTESRIPFKKSLIIFNFFSFLEICIFKGERYYILKKRRE